MPEIAYTRWNKLPLKSANIRENVFKELRALAEHPPIPEASWDLIWVFSGPETILGKPEDTFGNQDLERIEEGLRLQRLVTALRLDVPKRLEDVTKEDIIEYGPIVFYNGTERHNQELELWLVQQAASGTFPNPRNKIVISDITGVRNTADQFEKFPKEILPASGRKLVLLSDYYHLPRIWRLYKLWSERQQWNLRKGQIVPYPTRQKDDTAYFMQQKLRKKRIKGEVRAIEDRVGKGWLPDEG